MPQQRSILLTGNARFSAKPEWDELAAKHDIQLVQNEANSPEEFLEQFKHHNIVAIANNPFRHGTAYPDSLIEQLPSSLLAICHGGAGYDYVGSIASWKRKNIQVSNTPNAVATSTADTALYLLIGSLRNFNAFAHDLREGGFGRETVWGFNSTGRTLGIIGLGGIGTLARDKIVGALDFSRILYHNRRQAPPDVEKDSVYVDLDTLAAESDAILVVVPLSKSTFHLLDADLLRRCKRGVIIVNVSRGAVIDENALVGALESGQVRTVGLDVFENEPKIHPKLLSNQNVLLLPHCGGRAEESRRNQELDTIANIDSLLTTGKVKNLVPTW